MSNFVANVLEIVKGDFSDYMKLKQYHYVPTDPVCVRSIYKARARFPHTKKFPEPLAVIVYMVPIKDSVARNRATDGYFLNWKKLSERQSKINKYVNYLARIIVDPRFHKIGIGSNLLEETLKLQNVPLVETMTPIDFTSKMFIKAGFEMFYQETPERYTRIQNALFRCGVPAQMYHVPEVVNYRIEHLKKSESEFLQHEIKIFLRGFHHHEKMPRGPARVRYLLSKINYPNSYLLWRHPKLILPPFKK
jgi:GNAT superfamily N-acetyltransferase